MIGFPPHLLIEDPSCCINPFPIRPLHILAFLFCSFSTRAIHIRPPDIHSSPICVFPIPLVAPCSVSCSTSDHRTGVASLFSTSSSPLNLASARSPCRHPADSGHDAKTEIDAGHARVNKDTNILSGQMKQEEIVDRPRGSAHLRKKQTDILGADRVAKMMRSSSRLSTGQPASGVVMSSHQYVTLGMIGRARALAMVSRRSVGQPTFGESMRSASI
jgi:hypothetical protein